MEYGNLINADVAHAHLNDPNWRIIDCQYDLKNEQSGFDSYRLQHIPGAVFADLKKDLSSPVTSDSGRHPLPDINDISDRFGKWGIKEATQVVVYDDAYGSFAGRLWWLLKWLGHQKVAVLNGGLSHWIECGYPVNSEPPSIDPVSFVPKPDMNMIIDADTISNELNLSKLLLIDVRDSERFKGVVEPIDKIAGHVPGAVNIPWKTNIDDQGLYLGTDELRKHYEDIFKIQGKDKIAFMCGSGVTACHSLIVMDYLGIKNPKLYPGSWSEWISDPSRPVESSS